MYKGESLQNIARQLLMKKKKTTVISLMLATAALSAAFSGVFLNTDLTASAATDNYELDGLFLDSTVRP